MNAREERAARYAAVVARNQARLAAMKDKKTADMFAGEWARENNVAPEELTLRGESFTERVSEATADIQREEPEQSQLF